MKRIALPVLLMSFVVGCSKDESPKEKGAPLVPQELSFAKPSPGTKLTKEQANEIKLVFKNKSMMILPPGELVFPPKSMSPQERQEKEAALAQQDKNSYDLLKDIQAGCSKGRPTTVIDATFPTDGDFAIENLQLNDKMNYSMSSALKGSGCPVDYSAGLGLGAQVEQVNKDEKSITISAGASIKGQGLMLNSKYAQLLKSKGLVVDGSISGLAAKKDAQNSFIVNYKISGTYYTLDYNIPYTANVQMLAHSKAEAVTRQEMVINTTMQMPQFNARIDYYIVGSQDPKVPAKEEIYLNGHLTSREEFTELFGDSHPALDQKNVQSLVETLQ